MQKLQIREWAAFLLMAFLVLGADNYGRSEIGSQEASAAPAGAQAAVSKDPWAALRFLLGEWIGVEGAGQPGLAVSGGSTFAFDLGGKIMVRRNRADYAPKPGEKTGISHQDLLLIYEPIGQAHLRAFYVDNEGHDIYYLVAAPHGGYVVFESDRSEKGPRYRLEYLLNPDRTLTITFSIAPPGAEFKVYTKGLARRK
jgi:hypothetical protein